MIIDWEGPLVIKLGAFGKNMGLIPPPPSGMNTVMAWSSQATAFKWTNDEQDLC